MGLDIPVTPGVSSANLENDSLEQSSDFSPEQIERNKVFAKTHNQLSLAAFNEGMRQSMTSSDPQERINFAENGPSFIAFGLYPDIAANFATDSEPRVRAAFAADWFAVMNCRSAVLTMIDDPDIHVLRSLFTNPALFTLPRREIRRLHRNIILADKFSAVQDYSLLLAYPETAATLLDDDEVGHLITPMVRQMIRSRLPKDKRT